MSAPREDWQVKLKRVEERSKELFETGQWSDCKFIVGQDSHQQIFNGHKLILAMSSPVFEAMFFGSMPEKSDLISIKDVQPNAFKALLQYIYTNDVDLSSFELACELCYCAKKYMFPFLVQHCTRYMWSDLCPKNVCRAYEFSSLFEEFEMRDQCLNIIKKQTREILRDSSFNDIEFSTLMAILSQPSLNIDSELDLYHAIENWCKAECTRKQLNQNDQKCMRSMAGDALYKIRFLTLTPKEFADGPGQSTLLTQEESFAILMNILSSANNNRMPKDFDTNRTLRNVDFVKSSSSSSSALIPCPSSVKEGWSSYVSRSSGNRMLPTLTHEKLIDERRMFEREKMNEPLAGGEMNLGATHRACSPRGPKFFCTRNVYSETDVLNLDILDSCLSFTADKNICIVGIVVPTQVRKSPTNSNFSNNLNLEEQYTEVVYAYLLDSYGSRLTYTYFTSKVKTGEMMEISFNRAIYIQKNKVYRVEVVFNKAGWYPSATCAETTLCDSVIFYFNVRNKEENIRDGLIRSIVFT